MFKNKKILCICDGGNVRSVALAQRLKEMGNEAISMGMQYFSNESFLYFVKWADAVVDVRDYLPEDKWGNPRDVELAKIIEKLSGELK